VPSLERVPSAKEKIEGEFVFKVRSIPLRNDRCQKYYADIITARGRPLSCKTAVNDYSRVNKEFLATYRSEGNFSSHFWKNRICRRLWIRKKAGQERLPDGLFDRMAGKTAFYLKKIYRDFLDQTSGRFMAAVFLGRREFLPPEVRAGFREAGLMHLLAISGLHMGLVTAVLFCLLKFLRVKYRPRLIIALLGVGFYAFLVGAQPANLRAALMCAVFGLTFLLKRKPQPFNALGLSGLILLFFDPLWLANPGFQLSYSAVLSIFLGYRVRGLKLFSGPGVLVWIKNIFFSSFCVFIGISPLTAYYFEQMHFLTVFSNILMIPLFTAVIAVNFIFIMFSFSPVLALWSGTLLSFLARACIRLAFFSAGLPLSAVKVKINIFFLIGYYSLIFVCFGLLKMIFNKGENLPLKKILIG